MQETPAGTAELQAELYARSSQSLASMFVDRVRATPDARAFTYPDKQEVWHDMSWREAADLSYAFAAALIGRGLHQEDRVAIVATTRIEWILADYGIALAGGATTTVYPNTQIDDVFFILSDSDSRIAVAEDDNQVRKILAHSELDEAIPQVVARTTRDHLATLIYTSGTTGRPKGVRLKHGAWSYLAESVELVKLVTPDLLAYLWLPLSHSFGKSMIVFQAKYGFQTAVDGRIDKIVDNLAVVKPSFMCGVPRIFEKVRAAVLTGDTSRGLQGKVAHWAFAMGYKAVPYRLEGKPMPALLKARFKVADKLVFLAYFENRASGRDFAEIQGRAAAWRALMSGANP